MSCPGSPIERLAESSLIVVTGKGGVGKTMVTGLLARAVARRGRNVLALEADPRESLHRLFGVPPSDGATVPAGGGVALHHLRPRAALDELVARRLGSRWVASRVAESGAYEQFAEGAPGLKELAVFAWILERLRSEDRPGDRPETVVLDAPAGGHAAAWLEAPRLVAEAIASGPAADLARELDAALADGARTAMVVVTLAEEMPVTESLELAERLRAHNGRLPDLAVVNGLLPPWSAECGDADEDPAASMWSAWRRLQQRERARLGDRLPIPSVELPLLAEETSPDLLAGLATHVEADPVPQPRLERPASVPAERRPAGTPAASVGSGMPPLLVVVGAGGVGKTTLAASVAAFLARRGDDTLVMTFDPSLRLRQALDFLDAPRRIVSFLDSRALKLGLKDWFDDAGRLRTAHRMGALGRRLESYLDEVVGLALLREMTEFFQAFAPLYAGFHERALEVERLLRSPETGFLLVTTGEPARVPDALYFARKLAERGMRLTGVVVNRIHPSAAEGVGGSAQDDGRTLLAWLSDQDRRGSGEIRRLLRDAAPVVEVPLASTPPAELGDLTGVGERLLSNLAAREEPSPHVLA